MQENWIGKSEGAQIRFTVQNSQKEIPVFTTRPDTIYGVTYMVLAAEHPLVEELIAGTEYETEVRAFVENTKLTEVTRTSAEMKRKESYRRLLY